VRTSSRRVAVATLVAVALGGLAGCGSSPGPAAEPTPVPGAAQNGRMTIGIPFDEPGLGVKDGDTYSGFDVETAKYVAKAVGVPEANITWVEANGADREQLLESGGADMIVSTFTINDERKQKVDFAGPYFLAHQDLLVRRNEEEIRGTETLTGKNLCTIGGTTSLQNILSRYGDSVKVTEKQQYSECVTALANNEVDAVTTDDVILAGYAASPQYQGKLKVIGRGFSDENYGIGVKKGNTTLKDQVNAALKQYVSDGSWQRNLATNVAPSGYRIPSPPTPGAA
jgi:glutamate transport system substrate-binding protein